MKISQLSVPEALNLAHVTFLEGLGKLERAAGASGGEGLPELRARLVSTHTEVKEHFRFEEQNGYMGAVRKREPRLEHTIQQLEEEHRQLLRSLETLLGVVQAATSLDNVFREKVRAWVERVRHHEARENEVIQDAYNQDISAED